MISMCLIRSSVVFGFSCIAAGSSSVGLAQSGAVDTSFDPGSGVENTVYSLALSDGGEVILGGLFDRVNSQARTNVARLGSGGGLDAAFDPGIALTGDFPYVSAGLSEPLGSVLFGGSFATAASTNLARFSDAGVLDPAFAVQTDDVVNAIARLTNYVFLVGGFFRQVNGKPSSGIARLGSNGELDSDFAPVLVGDPFAVVFAIAVQRDGKLVIGGAFNSVNDVPCTNIARLNPDGTFDAGFRAVSAQGGQLGSGVYALALDLEGRIVAAGDFAIVNGVARTNLVRLNADGSLDVTFDPGTDAAVNAVVVQPDSKVLVGGYFAQVNGVGRNGVARLNVDGSLDASFDPGTGADGVVYALALQPDGKVLIGGGFQNVNGVPRGGIARLLNTVGLPVPRLFNPVLDSAGFHVSLFTVIGHSYSLEYRDVSADSPWIRLPSVSGTDAIQTLVDSSAPPAGRLYRVAVE